VSRGQRLGFLAIAAVIAIGAVIVLGVAGGDDAEPTGAAAPAEPTPATPEPEAGDDAEQAEPESTPRPRPPLLRAGRVRDLRATQGERVRFRVRHDTPEHVHVHGYDIFQDLEPGATHTVSFRADITGIFEIELEDSAELLAHLRVEPE
jgi:pyruvate/2-oxoglutarate dehydrogenase complex dihydrolipoamide acyltransferase (E2) component